MATTIACPHCNKPLTANVTLNRAPQGPAQLTFDHKLPASVAIARPFPVFRGDGYQQMRQWGAVTDVPTRPGAPLQDHLEGRQEPGGPPSTISCGPNATATW